MKDASLAPGRPSTTIYRLLGLGMLTVFASADACDPTAARAGRPTTELPGNVRPLPANVAEPADAGEAGMVAPDAAADGGAATFMPDCGPLAPTVPVAEVTLGIAHACARTTTGSVWCWGANDARQIGSDCGYTCERPVRVEGVQDVVQIAAAGYRTCAVGRDRRVTCWGDGFPTRFVPPGTKRTVYGPVARVPRLENVLQVTTGEAHACAILLDGSLKCWGSNSRDELGVGRRKTEYSRTPLVVPGLHHVVQATAGDDTTCALTQDRSLYCWGNGFDCDRPRKITNVGVVAEDLVGAGDFRCVLGQDKTIRCASPISPIFRQGPESSVPPCFSYDDFAPQPWPTLTSDVAAVALSGNPNACVIRADRSVACWPLDDALPYGRSVVYAEGPGPLYPAPTPVAGLADVKQVAVGRTAACAITSTNRLLCWGTGPIGRPSGKTPAPPAEPDWPEDAR